MALSRCGLLQRFSQLQLSSFSSFAASRQNGSNPHVTAHVSLSEMKPLQMNHACIQYLTSYDRVVAGQHSLIQHSVHLQPMILSGVIVESLDDPASESPTTAKEIRSYNCPSRCPDNLVILDNLASITSFYDCPVSTRIDSLKAPSKQKSEIFEGPGKKLPVMEAKIIMRIRHKKMKKHQRKKLLKRMYFVWRKRKLARKAKKMKRYYSELETIKKSGEEFNALEFVKGQLESAKKGGYTANIGESSGMK